MENNKFRGRRSLKFYTLNEELKTIIILISGPS